MALDKSQVQNLLDEFVVNNKKEILDVENENPELHNALFNALSFLSTRFGTQSGISKPIQVAPTPPPAPTYSKYNFAQGNLFLIDFRTYPAAISLNKETFSLLYEGDYKDKDGIENVILYTDNKQKSIGFRKSAFEKYIDEAEVIPIPSSFGYYQEDSPSALNPTKVFTTVTNNQSVVYKGEQHIVNNIENVSFHTINSTTSSTKEEVQFTLTNERTRNVSTVTYPLIHPELQSVFVRISTIVPFALSLIKGQFFRDTRDNGMKFLLFTGNFIRQNAPLFMDTELNEHVLHNNYIFFLMQRGILFLITEAVFIDENRIIYVRDVISDPAGNLFYVSEIKVDATLNVKERFIIIKHYVSSSSALQAPIEFIEVEFKDLFTKKGWLTTTQQITARQIQGTQPLPTPPKTTTKAAATPKKSAAKTSTTTNVAKTTKNEREVKRLKKLIDGLQILADMGDDDSIKEIADIQKQIDDLTKS